MAAVAHTTAYEGDHAATAEEAALLEFDPVPIDYRNISNEDLSSSTTFVRASAIVVNKTKSDLVSLVGRMTTDGLIEMIDGIQEAREMFEAILDVVKAAEMRLIVAASVVETTRH